MKQIFKNFVSILFVILCSHLAGAADETASGELSLDDEFSEAQVQPQPNMTESGQSTTDTQSVPNNSSDSLDLSEPIEFQAQDLPPAAPYANPNVDPAENVNLASAQEILQSDNALYGFSMGAFYTQAVITGSYKTYVNNGGKLVEDPESVQAGNKLTTKPIQFVGVTARYAILPFNSLGVDINASYLQSVNHENISLFKGETATSILILKGEMNLAYSFKIGKALPIYFLAGIGFEKNSGRKILEIMNANGQGYQYGIGTVVFSSFNVEGLYTYYSHRISTQVRDNLRLADKDRDVETDSPRFVSKGFLLRGTYSF